MLLLHPGLYLANEAYRPKETFRLSCNFHHVNHKYEPARTV